MTPAGDREAFLRAIAENPEDDTLRLVFADWLDEQPTTKPCPSCGGGRPGQWFHAVDKRGRCTTCKGMQTVEDTSDADRAEFIRVQCEIAAMVRSDPRGENGSNTRFARRLHHELQPRESELLALHGDRWGRAACPGCGGRKTMLDPATGHDPHYCPVCRCTGDLLFRGDSYRDRPHDSGHNHRTVTFARGFPDGVTCLLAELSRPGELVGGVWEDDLGFTPSAWASAVATATPVSRFVATDATPPYRAEDGHWSISRGVPHLQSNVPSWLFDEVRETYTGYVELPQNNLKWFHSEAEARDAQATAAGRLVRRHVYPKAVTS